MGSKSVGWQFQDMRNSAAASNRSGDIHKPGTPRERRHESGTGEYGDGMQATILILSLSPLSLLSPGDKNDSGRQVVLSLSLKLSLDVVP
jgi:hypothetical protein